MNTKPKKIIFSSNASWYLWNFRKNLMHELKKDGHEIIVLSSRDEYTERLAKEFPWVQMYMMNRGGMNPVQDMLLIFEYILLYRKLKPDLVFNVTIKPNIYSSIACRILKIPVVATVTGLGYAFSSDNWLQKLVCLMYRVAFSQVKKVMFQNEDDHHLFITKKLITPEKTELVPGSGVDIERFSPVPLPGGDKKITFLLLARMLRDKGIPEYIAAASEIKKKFPDVAFMLAGPWDVKNPACITKQEIEALDRDHALVYYMGTIDDVVPLIAKSDVGVLPSWYREGIPKSMLEAMSIGRPIITTDVPGCRSVVVDNKNGYCIKPKSVDALVEAMEKMILLSSEERQSMGQVGREMVIKQFDQKIVFQKHKEIIQEIFG